MERYGIPVEEMDDTTLKAVVTYIHSNYHYAITGDDIMMSGFDEESFLEAIVEHFGFTSERQTHVCEFLIEKVMNEIWG
jgi:hypothetical protein